MAAPVLLGLNLDLGQKRLGLKIRSSFIYKRIPKFTDKIYAAKIISPRSCLQAIYSRLLSNGFCSNFKRCWVKNENIGNILQAQVSLSHETQRRPNNRIRSISCFYSPNIIKSNE